jgi:hypothetical protein
MLAGTGKAQCKLYLYVPVVYPNRTNLTHVCQPQSGIGINPVIHKGVYLLGTYCHGNS